MSFSDDFERADGALGANYTVFGDGDGLEIISGTAGVVTGSNGEAVTTQEFTDDQTVSVVFAAINDLPGTGGIALYARLDSLSFNTTYGVTVNQAGASAGSAHYLLFDYDSLSEDVVAATPTVGQTLTLSAIGSTISVLVDDVVIISVTNTSTPSGPLAGFQSFFSYTDVAFASFSVTDVPALGTMFMPPSFGRIPTTWPRGHEMNALMRNFRPRQEGTNVYYLSDGTVTETDPDSTTVFWDKSWGSPYVVMAWWGSTADPYELTTAQAQALTDAGYSLT